MLCSYLSICMGNAKSEGHPRISKDIFLTPTQYLVSFGYACEVIIVLDDFLALGFPLIGMVQQNHAPVSPSNIILAGLVSKG